MNFFTKKKPNVNGWGFLNANQQLKMQINAQDKVINKLLLENATLTSENARLTRKNIYWQGWANKVVVNNRELKSKLESSGVLNQLSLKQVQLRSDEQNKQLKESDKRIKYLKEKYTQRKVLLRQTKQELEEERKISQALKEEKEKAYREIQELKLRIKQLTRKKSKILQLSDNIMHQNKEMLFKTRINKLPTTLPEKPQKQYDTQQNNCISEGKSKTQSYRSDYLKKISDKIDSKQKVSSKQREENKYSTKVNGFNVSMIQI